MSIFDELRQKYNNLYYPNAGERQFQAVRNNLTKDILSDQLESARQEYKSLLSGTGFNARSVDATRAGQQQEFSIDPVTGQTILTTPEYMSGFRSDETDFLPGGSTYQTGFDSGESVIDPVTGLPREVVADTTTGLVGQGAIQAQGGGFANQGRGREDRVDPVSTPRGYDPYGTFNMANPNPLTSTALGLIGAVTGIPTGLFSGITSGFAKQKLKNTYGINNNDIDSINKNIEDGMSLEDAMDKFRETSEKHKIGRDLIGTGEIDPGFGLVSDDKLRDLTKKAEDDFDSFLDDYDDGVYADPDKGKDKPDDNNQGVDTTGGFQDDDAGGYQQGPGGQGGNNQGGGGGFQGGANPSGKGQYGGR
tara:strand:- start:23 stop:1111 length:1089 start_codon:yes stop_codon:yes gene_type:complete